jgi:hypothetical protein
MSENMEIRTKISQLVGILPSVKGLNAYELRT